MTNWCQTEHCIHQLYRHTMKMEQKMERLRAKMDFSLEEMKASQEE
jgi:hypothetical protein